jgi:type II restriction/modification system DNA methylase subunit YeeA
MKDVVRNYIYGVDKNPLAVERCKMALWLEAYNPGEPFNFLDYHIKCGDAIVGLAHRSELEKGIADEAFKTLWEMIKTLQGYGEVKM